MLPESEKGGCSLDIRWLVIYARILTLQLFSMLFAEGIEYCILWNQPITVIHMYVAESGILYVH